LSFNFNWKGIAKIRDETSGDEMSTKVKTCEKPFECFKNLHFEL